MRRVKLPDGRIVSVGRFDDVTILVEFEEEVKHQLRLPNTYNPEEVAKAIHNYLYGYTDPETGEHIKGYFELIKDRKTCKEWYE